LAAQKLFFAFLFLYDKVMLIRRLIAVLVVCVPFVFATSASAAVKAPSGKAFYNAPAKLIKGKPGTVIWSRQIKYSASGRVALPSSSKTMLVLYRSLSVKGKPIAVSGTIDIPKGKAPATGWKVISWAHGTVGAADVCAPSRATAGSAADGYVSYATPTYDRWVKAGYAVLRTDYEGLGTPGPHPYLIGRSEGRSIVDIALAAKKLYPTQLSDDWVIGGHSQGGHASLFAASLAPQLAASLNLKGVFAFAPASHLYEQGQAVGLLGDSFKGLTGLIVMILNSAARESNVNPKTIVSASIAAKLPQLEKVCSAQLGDKKIFGNIAPNKVLKTGATTASVDQALRDMNPNLKIAAPALILQGLSDTTVFPAFSNTLNDELVANGNQVDYQTFAGLNHSGVVTDPASEAVVTAWLKAVLP
jgi:pimeloyl-ACP methyl ester carboxylesterase